MKELTYQKYLEIEDELFQLYLYDNNSLSSFELQVLEFKDLKKNNFYIGDCRNSDISFWDGEKFYYIRTGWWESDKYIESINHESLEKYECADVFVPFALLTTIPDNIKDFFHKEGFEFN